MNDLLDISIENYEGPLDLLIHLVHRNEMNIFDVPISEITNHFVAEIRRMQQLDMEVAADFIHMASYLIYLKSRSLLPREAAEGDLLPEEEGFNFAQALIELSYCKELAVILRECAEVSGRYLSRHEGILLAKEDYTVEEPYRLADAFFILTQEKKEEKVVVHSRKEQADDVARQTSSILMRRHETLWSELTAVFTERFERAIAFSTVLTMAKNRLIRVVQENNFADILMRRLSGNKPPQS